VPTVLKSGSLSLLEPSGPVQACNGIALSLPLPDKEIDTKGEVLFVYFSLVNTNLRRFSFSPLVSYPYVDRSIDII